MKETIDKLNSDAEYYGAFGKSFLSNSDINALLNNPKMFKKDTDKTTAMLVGSYFHTAMLEPEKLPDFTIVDASTRTTNIYKDAKLSTGQDLLLLRNECDEINRLIDTMKGNLEFYDAIYRDGNQYEVPMVGEIFGHMWKGKADIICDDMIIDIKTTSNINDFRWSAKKYNYDSQAYIYQELFGKPLVFYVIDKSTGMMGIFEPSEDFIENGRSKVLEAISVYERFFSPTAWDNIDTYVIREEL